MNGRVSPLTAYVMFPEMPQKVRCALLLGPAMPERGVQLSDVPHLLSFCAGVEPVVDGATKCPIVAPTIHGRNVLSNISFVPVVLPDGLLLGSLTYRRPLYGYR